MIQNKFILLIVTCCACVSGASLNAATIPAGTTLTVRTVSLVNSNRPGKKLEAKIAQDVSVKGNVVLKAGTKAIGKVTASRAIPRKTVPLTVELSRLI